ncbi:MULTISPECIES: L-serine ammonia-lyase [Idiomarina]|jgi:L-serine dehydratase|uniref:L-serine ammonia-lyase n=2 Tax=Idiomarinaceae TaxID=267893 RepID=UPI000C3FAC51|nr:MULTISPECIES: L-serine ammonia-lyase [Idiomarina]MAB21064.1 L-serine ammonia-lyase [Idiomarina sp.]MBH94795.1 L-serine ammonia-lyase [Idiomarina sp.]QZN90113.1 L-serine ammonia-lyase [Idiomarina abyssalis]HAS15161.1 L-serine ammonia-lyase [Idiomarina abyssalis]|tara:strand:+ start:1863 stop:3236 length:1374 start_codon:yes stop_codon:yes gene_type:complete
MISVFDIYKIGIGPSSSHTVGPMKAAYDFLHMAKEAGHLDNADGIKVELFGSLGQTGKGHGTGKAVILGLAGETPESVDTDSVEDFLEQTRKTETLNLLGEKEVSFPSEGAITFHRRKTMPKHANAMELKLLKDGEIIYSDLYYSIGGGFIVRDEDFDETLEEAIEQSAKPIPYPFDSAADLLAHCKEHGMRMSSLMMANEKAFRSEEDIRAGLMKIWRTMQESIKNGITTEGILPGGLKVRRRASSLYQRLKKEKSSDAMQVMDWVDLYALAVNEENAAGGRIVTAPTNGAAGIIPAVMSYADRFIETLDEDAVVRFLLTSAAIGILYKKNASISGAEVGCQGEVGVACSMAAGALAEFMGGDPSRVENAAEIGMEHNLGLTCDPVGGLVQVPCIERNAMGSVKAINAARLAMRGEGDHKVSLDKVIKTMWDTGNDMKTKYKETARGGLAVNIIEC